MKKTHFLQRMLACLLQFCLFLSVSLTGHAQSPASLYTDTLFKSLGQVFSLAGVPGANQMFKAFSGQNQCSYPPAALNLNQTLEPLTKCPILTGPPPACSPDFSQAQCNNAVMVAAQKNAQQLAALAMGTIQSCMIPQQKAMLQQLGEISKRLLNVNPLLDNLNRFVESMTPQYAKLQDQNALLNGGPSVAGPDFYAQKFAEEFRSPGSQCELALESGQFNKLSQNGLRALNSAFRTDEKLSAKMSFNATRERRDYNDQIKLIEQAIKGQGVNANPQAALALSSSSKKDQVIQMTQQIQQELNRNLAAFSNLSGEAVGPNNFEQEVDLNSWHERQIAKLIIGDVSSKKKNQCSLSLKRFEEAIARTPGSTAQKNQLNNLAEQAKRLPNFYNDMDGFIARIEMEENKRLSLPRVRFSNQQSPTTISKYLKRVVKQCRSFYNNGDGGSNGLSPRQRNNETLKQLQALKNTITSQLNPAQALRNRLIQCQDAPALNSCEKTTCFAHAKQCADKTQGCQKTINEKLKKEEKDYFTLASSITAAAKTQQEQLRSQMVNLSNFISQTTDNIKSGLELLELDIPGIDNGLLGPELNPEEGKKEFGVPVITADALRNFGAAIASKVKTLRKKFQATADAAKEKYDQAIQQTMQNHQELAASWGESFEACSGIQENLSERYSKLEKEKAKQESEFLIRATRLAVKCKSLKQNSALPLGCGKNHETLTDVAVATRELIGGMTLSIEALTRELSYFCEIQQPQDNDEVHSWLTAKEQRDPTEKIWKLCQDENGFNHSLEKEYKALGGTDFSFLENDGLIAQHCLDWINQALPPATDTTRTVASTNTNQEVLTERLAENTVRQLTPDELRQYLKEGAGKSLRTYVEDVNDAYVEYQEDHPKGKRNTNLSFGGLGQNDPANQALTEITNRCDEVFPAGADAMLKDPKKWMEEQKKGNSSQNT